MTLNPEALEVLVAKDQIRELVMLYSRGVDRKDAALLRTLYAHDATDTHGDTYDGGADGYVDFLEKAFPYMRYSGHHVCNHLISVEGDEGEGEVYAMAFHVVPDGKGGWTEDFMCVRYIDRYRRENDQWRFAKRIVTYDLRTVLPFGGALFEPSEDPSRTMLTSRLFATGGRA